MPNPLCSKEPLVMI